jgi:hypothetical protein
MFKILLLSFFLLGCFEDHSLLKEENKIPESIPKWEVTFYFIKVDTIQGFIYINGDKVQFYKVKSLDWYKESDSNFIASYPDKMTSIRRLK